MLYGAGGKMMQSGSGKFYDAAKTRPYCDQIQDEYDEYSQAAGSPASMQTSLQMAVGEGLQLLWERN